MSFLRKKFVSKIMTIRVNWRLVKCVLCVQETEVPPSGQIQIWGAKRDSMSYQYKASLRVVLGVC